MKFGGLETEQRSVSTCLPHVARSSYAECETLHSFLFFFLLSPALSCFLFFTLSFRLPTLPFSFTLPPRLPHDDHKLL